MHALPLTAGLSPSIQKHPPQYLLMSPWLTPQPVCGFPLKIWGREGEGRKNSLRNKRVCIKYLPWFCQNHFLLLSCQAEAYIQIDGTSDYLELHCFCTSDYLELHCFLKLDHVSRCLGYLN